ncbi:unnamed protein product [Bathycoccus prasinos]
MPEVSEVDDSFRELVFPNKAAESAPDSHPTLIPPISSLNAGFDAKSVTIDPSLSAFTVNL